MNTFLCSVGILGVSLFFLCIVWVVGSFESPMKIGVFIGCPICGIIGDICGITFFLLSLISYRFTGHISCRVYI